MISEYSGIAPKGDLVLLQKLGEKLNRKSFLHVNSTRAGGGVAEILQRMIPILKEIGIDARWEVIRGRFKVLRHNEKDSQCPPRKFRDDYKGDVGISF